MTCCITYDNSFTFLILPYICFFSSIDRCFVLPVLFFLATYSFASLIFHQVYPGSPHSVLLFLPHQKSGTTVSSPVLQTDSPFLWFCTLPSETALTTRRGQREKCFFVCGLPSTPLQYLLPMVSLLPTPNERENDNIQHNISAFSSPNLLSFHLLQFFSHYLSGLFLKFLLFCLLVCSLTILWDLKSLPFHLRESFSFISLH